MEKLLNSAGFGSVWALNQMSAGKLYLQTLPTSAGHRVQVERPPQPQKAGASVAEPRAEPGRPADAIFVPAMFASVELTGEFLTAVFSSFL